jgi:hypothetical protein
MKTHCCFTFSITVILLCLSSITTNAQVANVSVEKFSININGHILKIPVYANHDLFEANTNIDKAVIVIHGTLRNAEDYFQTIKTAANRVSSSTLNTLIIAPQFLTKDDIDFHSLDAEHLYWTNSGWKAGSISRDQITNPRPERISSYAVLDSLMLHLAVQFPNLESIVFTGHSAGGQVVQRMAATSPVADLLCDFFSISTRFVVANPSSFLYMDNQRKTTGRTNQFSTPATSCNGYNTWKYGLENLYTYPKSIGRDSIRNMYSRRVVTYLIGENDDNPNSSSLDTSCMANLQGFHRYERGETYYNYLQHYYGIWITANHDFSSVPNVGHNYFEMYNSPQGIFSIFQKPFTSCNNLEDWSEKQKQHYIDIFPSPAADILNIVLDPVSNRNLEAYIYDVKGHLVINQKIKSEDPIHISSLESGIYILIIRSGEIRFYKNFVVDRSLKR